MHQTAEAGLARARPAPQQHFQPLVQWLRIPYLDKLCVGKELQRSTGPNRNMLLKPMFATWYGTPAEEGRWKRSVKIHICPPSALPHGSREPRARATAMPKHFVCNDWEANRTTVDINPISERTLREIYCMPFEYAVKEGKAWAIMSAYPSNSGNWY